MKRKKKKRSGSTTSLVLIFLIIGLTVLSYFLNFNLFGSYVSEETNSDEIVEIEKSTPSKLDEIKNRKDIQKQYELMVLETYLTEQKEELEKEKEEAIRKYDEEIQSIENELSEVREEKVSF